ncbi:methyltransferase [Streptomyces sp. 7-21]|uniref:DUF7059 domain-containing protein n=1 Tax=Streptomyces sp. 7-21 TaxID=2802283 RepID=UPI00191EC82B|nr:methyltransferase [Streptomyces sp. 7-21]MBL1068207.1 methyltransferase [Streptomyces sp. 7-21]
MSTVITDDLPTPGPGAARLRDALLAASFTPDGLLELLGATAYAALARGERVPALLATRGEQGTLATLVRLFLLRRAVPEERARAALPEEAFTDGWVVPGEGGTVRAAVDVRPFAAEGPGEPADWWVVSDAGREAGSEVVLGVGGASMTLAQLTVRDPVARALDLGTGCGIQALHASRHAAHVTATDVNPRALRMAALTMALSGAPEPDLRQGPLFEPLGGEPRDESEAFGLIVSNPPFVISPAAATAGQRLTYRDSGMAGDELCRTLVHRSAAYLADGGWCHVLANWQHVEGEDWRERLAGWVPPGCDAWIVQREEQDVAQYAELWLRDAGAHRGDPEVYEKRYEEWLTEFAARRTRSVGFGWITLRKSAAAATRPAITVEEWPHAVEQPLGETIKAHFARQDFLRGRDDTALLRARFRLADGVTQEQVGQPGAEDPEHVILRQRHGMMRARAVDTVAAGFAGSCDGTLVATAILDAIAQLLGEDEAALRAQAPTWLRPLVEQGFLVPVP